MTLAYKSQKPDAKAERQACGMILRGSARALGVTGDSLPGSFTPAAFDMCYKERAGECG